MNRPERISAEDVRWLLHHDAEFKLEFSGIEASIKGIYAKKEVLVCEDIRITEAVRTGISIMIEGRISEVTTPDEAERILKSAGMPDDGISLTGYDVSDVHYRFNDDKNDELFFSSFHDARNRVDFIEIDMEGLLKKYLPVADSIKLFTIAMDPKGFSDDYLKQRPEVVERTNELFDILKNVRDDPDRALSYLDAPQLKDSLIDAEFRMREHTTCWYECEFVFRLDERVIKWMGSFETDFEMGELEDLCFCRGDELLYVSISHEQMRSSIMDGDPMIFR